MAYTFNFSEVVPATVAKTTSRGPVGKLSEDRIYGLSPLNASTWLSYEWVLRAQVQAEPGESLPRLPRNR